MREPIGPPRKGDWRTVADALCPYVQHRPVCKTLLNSQWACTCGLAGWLARAEALRATGLSVRQARQAARAPA